MFDARKLLDQVMGALPPGTLPTGTAQSPATGGNGGGQLMTGALAGGVIGLLAGNKRARKFARKSAGTALTLGGLAAVAAIGYTAWQRQRSGHGGAAGGGMVGSTGAGPLQLPPADSAFAPARAPQGQDHLARGVMVAMIQGAKADGHVDAGEQARIFENVGTLGLDAEAKAFVMDELAAPLDVARVAAFATTPEVATELYAAALMAMDPDTPQERQFLESLRTALNLETDLAREVEQAVQAAAGA